MRLSIRVSAQEVSFRELPRRSAESGRYNQQVVFFTSEEPDQLAVGLEGVNHTVVDFGADRLLRPSIVE